MKTNKNKSQKLLEAVDKINDPIREEVISKFGPIVKVTNNITELKVYFKELAERRGQKWTLN